jgi:hypothetical protein
LYLDELALRKASLIFRVNRTLSSALLTSNPNLTLGPDSDDLESASSQVSLKPMTPLSAKLLEVTSCDSDRSCAIDEGNTHQEKLVQSLALEKERKELN